MPWLAPMAACVIALAACANDDATQIDPVLPCADLCTAWVDCTDRDADQATCMSSCERQETDPSQQYELCSDCVEDQGGCSEGSWDCDALCTGVVPE